MAKDTDEKTTQEKITQDDIASEIRGLVDEGSGKRVVKKGVSALVGGVVFLGFLIYLIGKLRGIRSKTIVEVKRL